MNTLTNYIVQRKYLFSFIIFSLLLISLATPFLVIVCNGTEIVLKTRPVDPRDPFRGDYVTLGYEIDSIPLEKVRNYDTFKQDKPCYVILQKESTYYEVKEVTQQKPKTNEIYLKAVIDYMNDGHIRVHYSLNKYFVMENTGLELEEKASQGSMFVTIKALGGSGVITNVSTSSATST